MNKVQEFLQERGLTKRASYNQIRKVASLLKSAGSKEIELFLTYSLDPKYRDKVNNILDKHKDLAHRSGRLSLAGLTNNVALTLLGTAVGGAINGLKGALIGGLSTGAVATLASIIGSIKGKKMGPRKSYENSLLSVLKNILIPGHAFMLSTRSQKLYLNNILQYLRKLKKN